MEKEMNQEVASEMMDEAEGSTEEVVENTQEDVEETVERQEDVTQEEAETEVEIVDVETPLVAEEESNAMSTIAVIAVLLLSVCGLIVIKRKKAVGEN